jgi:hypothetical protein
MKPDEFVDHSVEFIRDRGPMTLKEILVKSDEVSVSDYGVSYMDAMHMDERLAADTEERWFLTDEAKE